LGEAGAMRTQPANKLARQWLAGPGPRKGQCIARDALIGRNTPAPRPRSRCGDCGRRNNVGKSLVRARFFF